MFTEYRLKAIIKTYKNLYLYKLELTYKNKALYFNDSHCENIIGC